MLQAFLKNGVTGYTEVFDLRNFSRATMQPAIYAFLHCTAE